VFAYLNSCLVSLCSLCPRLGNSLFFFLKVGLRVGTKHGDNTGGDGLATFSEGETLSLDDGEWHVKLHVNGNVVTGHAHLHILGQLDVDGGIGGTDEALGAVAGEEGLGATTFFGLEDVNFALEVTANINGAGLGQAHSSLDLFLGDTSKQHTDIVASLTAVERLVEGLNTSDGGGGGLSSDADHVDIVVDLDLALLDSTSDDAATAGDIQGRVDRHEEVLLGLTNWLLDGVVHGLNELLNSIGADGGLGAVESVEGGTLDEWDIVTVEVVAAEELTNLHLDELVHLLIIDQVNLVQEDDEVLNANLSAQEDVLTSLGHSTVDSGDDKDATIHACSASNHVLDVISVTGAVNVTIMACLGLVLHSGSVNSDTSGLLLRGLVNIAVVLEVGLCVLFSEVLGDGSSEGGLTVIDVT
jgi:hypothetical protein